MEDNRSSLKYINPPNDNSVTAKLFNGFKKAKKRRKNHDRERNQRKKVYKQYIKHRNMKGRLMLNKINQAINNKQGGSNSLWSVRKNQRLRLLDELEKRIREDKLTKQDQERVLKTILGLKEASQEMNLEYVSLYCKELMESIIPLEHLMANEELRKQDRIEIRAKRKLLKLIKLIKERFQEYPDGSDWLDNLDNKYQESDHLNLDLIDFSTPRRTEKIKLFDVGKARSQVRYLRSLQKSRRELLDDLDQFHKTTRTQLGLVPGEAGSIIGAINNLNDSSDAATANIYLEQQREYDEIRSLSPAVISPLKRLNKYRIAEKIIEDDLPQNRRKKLLLSRVASHKHFGTFDKRRDESDLSPHRRTSMVTFVDLKSPFRAKKSAQKRRKKRDSPDYDVKLTYSHFERKPKFGRISKSAVKTGGGQKRDRSVDRRTPGKRGLRDSRGQKGGKLDRRRRNKVLKLIYQDNPSVREKGNDFLGSMLQKVDI